MKQSREPLQFYSEPVPGVDTGELHGRLIVIEGPDAVGRSTQVRRLRSWLEDQGHAVLDTGMARSALAGKGIQQAKDGNTFGPVTMTLFYTTDFADRLENEIIPALRAGFVVLTDRYIFSLMARAIARGEDGTWIEKVAGYGLVPHAVYYLRAEVQDLVSRVVHGRGAFDYWESGMDMRFGADMYESFVRYQGRIIRALDRMAKKYDFVTIDASHSPEEIFRELQQSIGHLFGDSKPRRRGHSPQI
ncbi:MAG: dTMP kinase [Bryobacteraceae bacterium]